MMTMPMHTMRNDDLRVAIRRSVAPALVYTVLATLMAIFFLRSVGPLSVPDPDMHVGEIYALSTGQAFEPSVPFEDAAGNFTHVQNVSISHVLLDAVWRGETMVTNNAIVENLISLQKDPFYDKQLESLSVLPDGIDSESRRRSQYFPLAYGLQSTVFGISQACGASFWQSFQLIRVFNFLLCATITVFAIAIAPRGKWIYVLVGLLPAGVFLAVSISIDATIMPLMLLIVAITCQAAQRGRLTYAKAAVCCIAIGVLFFLKTAYVLVGFLLLVLPNGVIVLKKKALFVGVTMLAVVPIYLIWSGSIQFSYNPLFNVSENKAWAAAHPLEFAFRTVAGAMAVFWKPVGTYGWPWWSYAFTMVLCAITLAYRFAIPQAYAAKGFRDVISRWRLPVTGVLIVFVTLCAVACHLAFGWADLAQGNWYSPFDIMQERYLLPFAAFLPLLITPVSWRCA